MKSLRLLTLAATLALVGMAGAQAADVRPQAGAMAAQQGQDAVLIGLLLPAVQKAPEGDGAADLVTGAGRGGRPGDAQGLIGLLKPADQAGITDGTLPAVQMPTDQKNGDGRADLVTGAGGGATQGLAKTGAGTLVLTGANSYGSLRGLGSTQDLFANSRGGDQAAGAHGAGGGGGAGKVAYQDLRTTTKAGDGSVVPTDQLAGNGNDGPDGGRSAGKVQFQDFYFNKRTDAASSSAADKFANPNNGGTQLPAVQAIREAAKSSPSTGGGQAAGGTPKALNFTNSARK